MSLYDTQCARFAQHSVLGIITRSSVTFLEIYLVVKYDWAYFSMVNAKFDDSFKNFSFLHVEHKS